MSKTRVLLLFGGQSAEHEVSVISARSVYDAIDTEQYEVVLVGIADSGQWFVDGGDGQLLKGGRVDGEAFEPVRLNTDSHALVSLCGDPIEQGEFDVVFPLLHGPRGEDGAMQGLLELAGVAYVGAGVAASAVGMDKELARSVFASAGLKQASYTVIRRSAWQADRSAVINRIERVLAYPLFVKPANLGSSIGVSKAHDREGLAGALDIAAAYDLKIMVEASVEGARELECAVLGNDEPKTSVIGEIIPGAEFYDYTTKYLDDHSQLIVPAKLPSEVAIRVREMSIRSFRSIDGAGLGRVDFLFSPSGEIFLNEINTMPGFTPISMYPRLWQESGITYPKLIGELIRLALERHQERQSISTSRSA